MIKLLPILLMFTSCAMMERSTPFSPVEKRQDRVEQCVHRFIDKGVTFIEASKECAERIFEKVKR